MAEYLTFMTATGESQVNAIYADENVWLSQKMMGQLYDIESHTVTYHLQKIFSDNELSENSVTRKFRVTADDGKNYQTKHYNHPLTGSKPNTDLLPNVIRISHCSSFRQSASSFSMPLLPETSRCLHKPPPHRQCAAYPHKISVSLKPAERQSAVSTSSFQTAFPFQAV